MKNSKFNSIEQIRSAHPALENDIPAINQIGIKLVTRAENSFVNPSLPSKGGGNYVNS